jgi:hypothetical protein
LQARDRPACSEILLGSACQGWLTKLTEAPLGDKKKVQMTPVAQRKGEFRKVDTIQVPQGGRGSVSGMPNLKLPAKMYQPDFGSTGTGGDENQCSLPKVMATARSTGRPVAGTRASQKCVMNGNGVAPRYSQAAQLPTRYGTAAQMQSKMLQGNGVGAAGRPRQPLRPVGGYGRNNNNGGRRY